ncbi:hypothetical protein BaRGS_00000279 [Batillaria attramentaria]|uniref:Uncharacterized protein n=1 Tax=Batillaria attramentaria TaxID=370345 RepID=A0ABD0MDG8_9CAEN
MSYYSFIYAHTSVAANQYLTTSPGRESHVELQRCQVALRDLRHFLADNVLTPSSSRKCPRRVAGGGETPKPRDFFFQTRCRGHLIIQYRPAIRASKWPKSPNALSVLLLAQLPEART